ncbi:MFS transporter [Streptomyces sp. NPDC055400]
MEEPTAARLTAVLAATRSGRGSTPALFPTHIRAVAVGAAVALTRCGAAVGTFLVPVSLTELGAGPTMYIGAGITFAGFLACVAWAEETRNRSLEETGGNEVSARRSRPFHR